MSLSALSEKIGRTSNVQSGQIAGALDPRLADRIPATKVPCAQAVLSGFAHIPFVAPDTSRILLSDKSVWFVATGPSISPITMSGLPRVRSINLGSLTSSRGSIDGFYHSFSFQDSALARDDLQTSCLLGGDQPIVFIARGHTLAIPFVSLNMS